MHIFVVSQEAVRDSVHDRMSPPLLPDPLLPVPAECHSHACVRALRHGLLHPEYSRHKGYGEPTGVHQPGIRSLGFTTFVVA